MTHNQNCDRYHVRVKVREGGDKYAWRRVHPVGGDPYVFTKDEAEQYVRTYGAFDRENYCLEKLPE